MSGDWSRGDIEDAILDYGRSINVRKAEQADLDAIGRGKFWSRKDHYERIVEEENFLRHLRGKLGDMR